MDQRNRIRLAKIESDIGDTELQYRDALEFEKVIGKRTLLMSNVHLKKLEMLYKRKSKLNRVTREYREKRKSYDDVLKQRIEAVNKAEEDVKDVLRYFMQTAATTMITKNTQEFINENAMYTQLLKSKKIILANKRKALNNWLDRSEADMPKRSDSMKSSYGQFKEKLKERTAADDKLFVENFEERQDTISYGVLEKDPHWHKKVENNATIDLLTRPIEDKGE